MAADAIVIRVKLQPSDIQTTGREITRQLSDSLNASAGAAKETGRKIGNALNAGLEDSLRRTSQIIERLNQTLSNASRYRTEEEKVRDYQRRMEVISAQTIAKQAKEAAQVERIEADKQAKLEVLRERTYLKEIERQQKLERATQNSTNSFQTFLKRYSSTIREAGESFQQAGYSALILTSAIVGIGAAAVRSAIDIDKQVNVLRALTGSAEAAEARFAKLVETARQTPGLTTQLAATLDAQLRILNVTEQTIDRVLPAIGRLNAISPIEDPAKFTGNLVQLITQNFERQDLKELVGNSPFAGELIKQIFNVDSPTNAQAIRESAKKLGIKTTEDFFTAFAAGAENNPKLQQVSESLGTQIAKLQDRIAVALRPLGLRLLETIVPAVESLVLVLEKVLSIFAKLPEVAQTSILVFSGLAAAIAPVVIGLGGIIQFAGAIGNLTTVITALGAATTITTAGVGALSAGSVAAATGAAGISAGAATATVGLAGLSAVITPILITLGAIAVVAGVAVVAFKFFSKSNDDAAKSMIVSTEAARQQIATSQNQIDELQKLAIKAKLSNEEQKKIEGIYSSLNPLQKERVKLLADEAGGIYTTSGMLVGLIELLKQENNERSKKARADAMEAGRKLANQTLLTVSAFNSLSDRSMKLNKDLERNSKELNRLEKSNEGVYSGLTGKFYPAVDGQRKRVNQIAIALKDTTDRTELQRQELEVTARAYIKGAAATSLSTDQYIRQTLELNKTKIEGHKLAILLSFVAKEQRQASQATANTTGEYKLQADALKGLQDAMSDLNLGDFNKKLNDELLKVATDPKAKNPAAARKIFQDVLNDKTVEGNNLKELIEKNQRIEGNLAALRDHVSGGKKAAAQSSRAERVDNALDTARRRASESAGENQLRLDNDVINRSLINQEYAYSQGLKNTTEYYSQRQALQESAVKREIILLDEQIKKYNEDLTAAKRRNKDFGEQAKSKERIELEEKIGKATTDRVLKEGELGDIEIDTARQITAARKAQYDAQVQFAREARENTYQLDKDANDRALEELQRQYDVGLVSSDLYYKEKLELQQKNIQGSIDLNDQEIRDFKEKLGQYREGAQQRKEIEAQINELRTRGVILTRHLAEAEAALNRERNAPVTRLKTEIEDIRRKTEEFNNPELAAKRREKAEVEAAYEIAKANSDAEESIIKSRAKIADASIYHSTRANSIMLDHLAKQQSVTEAVAESMIKQYESVAGGIDKGIDKLTAKLGAFGDAVNGVIKAIVRNILANLFAPMLSGGGQQTGNNGILGGILNGVFGGRASGGVFGSNGTGPGGTPVFNPGYFNSSNSNSNNGGFFSLASASVLGSLFSRGGDDEGGGLFGSGIGIFNGFHSGGSSGGAGGGGALSGLKGAGQSLKDAAPLLGLTIGASLGGQSTLGKIAGGAGGFLLGNSIATGALFSNPLTAIIGAGLLIGGIFLGKAKQRRQDEEASGEYLKQALSAIQELKSKIASDEIDGSQAKSIFDNQILATFQQQISQLKTKSVRDSRLTNQVRDLRGNYEALIPPEIEAQSKRRADEATAAAKREELRGLIIPEFATGGLVEGSPGTKRLIYAHAGEIVINPKQQTPSLLNAAASAGVPGVSGSGGGQSGQPLQINVTLVVGKNAQNEIFVNGAKSQEGYKVIINQVENGSQYRDLNI